jgi:transposase
MRGTTSRQVTMLGVIDPEQLIPANHPIRRIKPLAEAALRDLEPTFERIYAQIGRPSIPPEHLLKSCLLMALYSIRSERQFCERLRYDLLFNWFLGLNVEDEPFDHSSFAKNRRRLLEHRVSRQFFEAVVRQARRRHLLSAQHFTVDGTLPEAWASMKSLRPRGQEDDPGDGNGYTPSNPDVDFKGQRRSNQTHYSPTDPEALMARKGMGKETKMCFSGHVLMENRHGLVVDLELTSATGTSEWEAALRMLERMRQRMRRRRCTLGADKGYDTRDFIRECQGLRVTPHVAHRESFWGSSVLAKLAPTPEYQVSQRKRKRVE